MKYFTKKPNLTIDVRCAIITEKVNICLAPPYFLLSKTEASCSLTPTPSKVGESCTLSRAQVLRLRLRCNIITEKVKLLLTLYRLYRLVKPKLLISLFNPSLQGQQNLHSDWSFSFDGTPYLGWPLILQV